MRASEPLKSKRLAISRFACSSAFFTSCLSTCETMSKDGMPGSGLVAVQALEVRDPAPGRVLDPGDILGRVVAAVHRQAQGLALEQQQCGRRDRVARGLFLVEQRSEE